MAQIAVMTPCPSSNVATPFWGNGGSLLPATSRGWVMPVGSSVQGASYRELINVLRQARVTAGISQAALASRLNTRQQFVSKFEAGERRLDVVEFMDIARALGLDPLSILRDLPLSSR